MTVPTVRRVFISLVYCLAWAASSSAQATAPGGASLSGRLLHALSRDPIAGVTVVLEELRREATSGADGSFTFDNLPPGSYHLSVRFEGFSSRRTEVTVSAAGSQPIDVLVEPDLHFQEVVSVSPEARSQFDTLQPTSVLAGQELSKQLEMSIGATLEHQPGVSSRSFGPAPSRPVIRGLDGDRVLILQDGQRMGDLSSQSGDHGVTVNPAAAQSIEVVRGPATLLYGASAIGGLVNVITDEIPTKPQQGASGTATFDLGSAASQASGAGDVHVGNGRVALHAGGGGQRSGDVGTPEGDVENSQSRGAFGNVGLSWTREKGYIGGSYGYDDSKYGIPVVEGGNIQLTPRRHAVSLRGAAHDLPGAFDAFRATLAVRRYRHDELEGEEVGTAFSNNTAEIEAMGSHKAVGRLKGSLGASVLDRAFDARGEEALSPAVDQNGAAAFLYEEVGWPHATLQFGGRVEHAHFAPAGEPERSFTNGSASLGLLVRPAGASERITLAAQLAHASRNPALEEMFFYGVHAGNFAVEIGNPNLGSEHAFGTDLSFRWRSSRGSGEVTVFRNDVAGFIYRDPLTLEEYDARQDEFAARFPDREPVEVGEAVEEGLSIVDFVGADAVLYGVEAHADVQLSSTLQAEFGADYVRGTLDTGEPLPRMPPFRLRGGLRYQKNALQAGGEVIGTATQDRVGDGEEPTDGYVLLKLFGSYSFGKGRTVNTLTARLDNATNELYRNHLSLIKSLVPEMGRNFKLLYTVSF